jgi:hypothetical protein
MTRAVFLVALALGVGACAHSHGGEDAGSTRVDAHATDTSTATTDAAAVDVGPTDAGLAIDVGPPVSCGPNRCRAGEICCNERCGVCAFADECVDYGCPDPGAP